MSDRKVAQAGVNTFKCICKKGSVSVPVTMGMMAKMRCGAKLSVSGRCHLAGHIQKYTLEAWPPFPLTRESRKYIRT